MEHIHIKTILHSIMLVHIQCKTALEMDRLMDHSLLLCIYHTILKIVLTKINMEHELVLIV